MANGIIPVNWGKQLRPSAVNTLDKLNEVIHFINQSDIHEFTFSDSGSGESVQTANSTQLLDLTIYGKSMQDGTPTPENPIPVQIVEAPIGLQTGETVTPIDMQGHTLAGLPDGTRDELDIDAAGVKTITQNVGAVTLDSTLAWLKNDYSGAVNSVFSLSSDAFSSQFAGKMPIEARLTDNQIMSNRFTGNNVSGSVIPNNVGIAIRGDSWIIWVTVPNALAETVEQFKTWLASNPVTLYYPLATPQTIELGTIEPPAIPDGSIIQINASLTPVIDAEWFTEPTLPKMMNSILGLIKSLHPDEFTASEGNALHSINPISISELKPIYDIQPIGEIETGYGHEEDNESEVQ